LDLVIKPHLSEQNFPSCLILLHSCYQFLFPCLVTVSVGVLCGFTSR